MVSEKGKNICPWLSAPLPDHKTRSLLPGSLRLTFLAALTVWASCGSFTTLPPQQTSHPIQSKNTFDDTLQKQPINNNKTPAKTDYLSAIEQHIISEINLARTHPREYARKRLIPLRTYYHGKALKFPGKTSITTVEGIRALDECIKELQAHKPLKPLSPKKGLTLAARDHVKDKGKAGKTGHTGSDNSTMGIRLNRYGRWHISAGENITYGTTDVGRIVTSWLIDDGVPSRRHRKNLLNETFRFVGVAFGEHRVYRYMCVIDFAAAYE